MSKCMQLLYMGDKIFFLSKGYFEFNIYSSTISFLTLLEGFEESTSAGLFLKRIASASENRLNDHYILLLARSAIVSSFFKKFCLISMR